MELKMVKVNCKNARNMPTCWPTPIGGVDRMISEVANSYYNKAFTGKFGVFSVIYVRQFIAI